jgi:hypothetical protein
MNNPTTPGSTDFPPEWLKYYTIDTDNKTIIPMDGTPPVRLSQLFRLSFYDPSSGGKSAKCQNGIAGLGASADRRIFALEAWGRNCSFGDAIEYWHLLNDKFKFHENWYEEVGAQKAVEDIILERNSQTTCRLCLKEGRTKHTHLRLQPKPFHPPAGKGEVNKDERMRLYGQAPFQEGRVYIPMGARGAVLKGQVITFPHGKLKDLFDSLCSGLHLIKYPPSDEYLAEQREAKERINAPREQRINTEYNYGGYV